MPNQVCLINPPLISQQNDPHTGIIFMPFMLANLSAFLKQQGIGVQVLDAFGLAPLRTAPFGNNVIQGLSIEETVNRIDPECKSVLFYFGGVVAYRAILELLKACKIKYPGKQYILMENAQAVTAISLRNKAAEFLELGFDCLLNGDAEIGICEALEAHRTGSPLPERPGLIFKREDGSVYFSMKQEFIANLDTLPFPDWTSFPLKQYWDAGYAHGPMEGPYLVLLTSRGCPVHASFV